MGQQVNRPSRVLRSKRLRPSRHVWKCMGMGRRLLRRFLFGRPANNRRRILPTGVQDARQSRWVLDDNGVEAPLGQSPRICPIRPGSGPGFPYRSKLGRSGSHWAMTRLISRAGATGSSRATLPVATSSQGREVGVHQSCPWGAGSAPVFCNKCGVPYAAATESRRPIARNTPSSVASLGLPASLRVR